MVSSNHEYVRMVSAWETKDGVSSHWQSVESPSSWYIDHSDTAVVSLLKSDATYCSIVQFILVFCGKPLTECQAWGFGVDGEEEDNYRCDNERGFKGLFRCLERRHYECSWMSESRGWQNQQSARWKFLLASKSEHRYTYPSVLENVHHPGPQFYNDHVQRTCKSSLKLQPSYAVPTANASFTLNFFSTTCFTKSNARLKSSNCTCGIPSFLQNAARSLSAPGFCFTNNKSACRAADISSRYTTIKIRSDE